MSEIVAALVGAGRHLRDLPYRPRARTPRLWNRAQL